MKQGFIKVGAGTPDLKVADCVYNADRIIQLIQEMGQAGAKIIVLPGICSGRRRFFWRRRSSFCGLPVRLGMWTR